MAHRYVKHPRYVGKSLAIRHGRRDRTVRDHEVLTGREWERYVALGFLVHDPNDVEETPKPKAHAQAKPAPAPAPAPAPTEPPTPIPDEPSPPEEKAEEPEPEPEQRSDKEAVSKSPASKVSGTGGKRRRGKVRK